MHAGVMLWPVSTSTCLYSICVMRIVCLCLRAPYACPVPSQCQIGLLWHMVGKVPREKKNANSLASIHEHLPNFCPKHTQIFARKTIHGSPCLHKDRHVNMSVKYIDGTD